MHTGRPGPPSSVAKAAPATHALVTGIPLKAPEAAADANAEPIVSRGTVIRRRKDVEAEEAAAAAAATVAADVPAAEPAVDVETVEVAAAHAEVAPSEVEVTADSAEVDPAVVVTVTEPETPVQRAE